MYWIHNNINSKLKRIHDDKRPAIISVLSYIKYYADMYNDSILVRLDRASIDNDDNRISDGCISQYIDAALKHDYATLKSIYDGFKVTVDSLCTYKQI
jgi:hypothetical protein